MMLPAMQASVRMDGSSREKPSVYLRPMAQPISISPATNRIAHAMTNPPDKAGSSPRMIRLKGGRPPPKRDDLSSRFILLFERDLFRKPVSTFRDHARPYGAAARGPQPRESPLITRVFPVKRSPHVRHRLDR